MKIVEPHAKWTNRRGAGVVWRPTPLNLPEHFAKEPNSHLDREWRDKTRTNVDRVHAFLKRHSWGYSFNEVVWPLRSERNSEGKWFPLYRVAKQRDIAETLKMEPSRVCEAITELKRGGYLCDRADVLILAQKPIPNFERKTRSYTGAADPDVRWKAACRGRFTIFREYSDKPETQSFLRENPEEACGVILSLLRAAPEALKAAIAELGNSELMHPPHPITPFRNSTLLPNTKSADAQIIENRPTTVSTDVGKGSSAIGSDCVDEAETVKTTLNIYTPANRSDARQMIAKCRQISPAATPEAICGFIKQKGPQAVRGQNPMGLLLNTVPLFFEGWAPSDRNNVPLGETRGAEELRTRIEELMDG